MQSIVAIYMTVFLCVCWFCCLFFSSYSWVEREFSILSKFQGGQYFVELKN